MLNARYARVSLRLKITNACNFNCYFCHREGDAHGEVMTPEDVRMLSRSIKNNRYIRKISLTGGEPFMNPHLAEILDIFDESDLPIKITTNGSLIEGWIGFLKEKNIGINVSLNHIVPTEFKKTTGVDSVSVVLNNIILAKNAKILDKINIAVTKYNKQNLDAILTWIDDHVGAVKVSVFNLVGDDPTPVSGKWRYITPEVKKAQQIFKFCADCPLFKKCEGCDSIRVSKAKKGFTVYVCPLGKEPRIHATNESELRDAINTILEEVI